MKSTTWQDDHPWTHIDWELDDVTPYQLNWFWSMNLTSLLARLP